MVPLHHSVSAPDLSRYATRPSRCRKYTAPLIPYLQKLVHRNVTEEQKSDNHSLHSSCRETSLSAVAKLFSSAREFHHITHYQKGVYKSINYNHLDYICKRSYLQQKLHI